MYCLRRCSGIFERDDLEQICNDRYYSLRNDRRAPEYSLSVRGKVKVPRANEKREVRQTKDQNEEPLRLRSKLGKIEGRYTWFGLLVCQIGNAHTSKDVDVVVPD